MHRAVRQQTRSRRKLDLVDVTRRVICRRPVQWVIQSVGRRQRAVGGDGGSATVAPQPKGLREQVRERALLFIRCLLGNVANSAQQVDTAICARVLYASVDR